METSLVPSQADSLFRDAAGFDHINRIAKVFADSQLVPPTFQKNIANCIIGLEIAHRLGASPLMVMQNLNLIKGKPSFSASFMIAAINSCGRFTPMEFNYVGERGTDEWGCYATSQNRQGKVLKGVTVTIGIAKKDGWYGRENSKWPTMPELMLSYRAATWFVRMFAPEMLMGFPTEDEVHDINVTPVQEQPVVKVPKNKGVTAMKNATPPAPIAAPPGTPPNGTPEAPVPGNLGEPAPEPPVRHDQDWAAPAQENAAMREPPPSAISAKEVVTPPQNGQPVLSRVRCEITGLTEKNVKKRDGNGVVTMVGLKGEWSGEAYFDGAKGHLPAVGAVIDITLEERIHNNAPIHLIKSFQLVG